MYRGNLRLVRGQFLAPFPEKTWHTLCVNAIRAVVAQRLLLQTLDKNGFDRCLSRYPRSLESAIATSSRLGAWRGSNDGFSRAL